MQGDNESAARFAFTERTKLKGILKYTVFRNGVPIETFEGHNLIVDGAREQMAHLVAGEASGRHIRYIAFGVSGTNPQVNDTELTMPFRKEISGYSFPEPGQVQFNWILNEGENNGMAIMEFGLICEDQTLFSRRIREDSTGRPITRPINKESDISIEGKWIIIF